MEPTLYSDTRFVLDADHFDELIGALRERGYEVLGPTLGEGAVVYDRLESAEDLPAGWTDEQEAGTYRLKPRDDNAYFGYTLSPQSWKRYLYPPSLRLWQARRENGSFHIEPEAAPPPKQALIGVRACELQAIAVQDRVFLQSPHTDPTYSARRANLFIVAVNCGRAGATCFCTSMNAGPRALSGFDLSLTEVVGDGKHYFVVEVGTEQGMAVLEQVTHRPATPEEAGQPAAVTAAAAGQMGRELDTEGLPELLQRNYEHPRWEQIATRCLSCSNCTMVCPTCFCHTVEDVTDLTGDKAERWRRWDSCFTMDFSYIHGGSVRYSPKARYRQWLTHKLSTWHDQFDMSGCVGCGRCITWCPVGIDITEEARLLREAERPARKTGRKPDDRSDGDS